MPNGTLENGGLTKRSGASHLRHLYVICIHIAALFHLYA